MATLHKTADGERLPAGMVEFTAGKEPVHYEMRGEERKCIEPWTTVVVPATVGRTAAGQGKGRITSRPLNILESCEPRDGESETDAENRLRRAAGLREKVEPSEVDEMELYRYYAGLRKTDPRYK